MVLKSLPFPKQNHKFKLCFSSKLEGLATSPVLVGLTRKFSGLLTTTMKYQFYHHCNYHCNQLQ